MDYQSGWGFISICFCLGIGLRQMEDGRKAMAWDEKAETNLV